MSGAESEQGLVPVRRALISVHDKTGVAALAQGLVRHGVELFSTGGTRGWLLEQGLEVHEVSRYTGFPEILGGRVKTLHPKVFAGILSRPGHRDDEAVLAEHGIVPFDLVVVNLYPFQRTVARPGCSVEEAIEQIDIGGPSLIRAAAKNHARVAVLTSPEQYAGFLEELERFGGSRMATRRRLAAEAFCRTAAYDRAIAQWFASQEGAKFPAVLFVDLHKRADLRYGENPHQAAALYHIASRAHLGIAAARQLHGKELSYNNLLDLESALACVRGLSRPAAVVVKHNNPCGAAVASSLPAALRAAWAGDPVSAYGSIVGLNRPVDEETAEVFCNPEWFVEAIVAPRFTPQALQILTTRPKWRQNVRLLEVGSLEETVPQTALRCLEGAVLVQDGDELPDAEDQWQVVTQQGVPEDAWPDLRFAWHMVRYVRSNAIVLAGGESLVGVGAGQMSRVDAVRLALQKAGDRARGSVLASDAFFPFPDSIQVAAEAGVRAVIQPGGSRRDAEVIDACNQAGIPMVFTGRRHFRH